MNSADCESFASFCTLLESLTRLSKADKLLKVEKYIKKFADPYLALRLMMPSIDNKRDNYGLKEHSLAKLFSDVLALPDKETRRLMHYKDPTYQEGHSCVAGDFISVLHSVLQGRASKELSVITLAEMDKILDAIAGEDKRGSLLKLVKTMSALELKWVAKIVLKDMKLEFSQLSVLRCLHPDALSMYNETSDLQEVLAWVRQNAGSSSMTPVQGLLFKKLKPMLAKRFPFGKEHMMDGKPYIVETKYDGERMLAHICKITDVVELYTRNNVNYTQHYKQIVEPLRQCLKGAQALLDGEMVAWDAQAQCVLPFGSNRQAAMDGGGTHLRYVVFDVLYYKNDAEPYNLCATPLGSRKKFLRNIVADSTFVQVAPVEGPFDSGSELEALLLKAIENKEEGIMVKEVSSVYKFNYRNAGWFKMKPEHSGLTDTLDLLVIGGYLANTAGRRKPGATNLIDNVSIFLLGAIGDNGSVVSFGRVGTGYSLQQLATMRDKLRPYVRKYEASRPPKWCQFKFSSKTVPDFILDDPQHGFVMEVRASEIVESSEYEFGHTMRFPTAKVPIRHDKEWNDAMTVNDLRNLTTESRMLAGKRPRENDSNASSDEAERAEKRRVPVVAPTSRIVAHFQATDISKIKSKSALFAAKEVFVVNADDKYSIQDIEKYIAIQGGRVVKNRRKSTDIIIAAKKDIRTQNIAQLNIDVLKYAYLFDCEDAGEVIVPRPWHMIATSSATKLLFKNLDVYGDHYVDPITPVVFDRISVPQEDIDTVSDELVAAARQLCEKASALD